MIFCRYQKALEWLQPLKGYTAGIRGAFTTGTPYTMPLLTVRELGQVLDMLRASEQKKAA